MPGPSKTTRYRVGDNPELDEKFKLYKKVNLFVGDAYHDELSKEEANTLIKLWGKARSFPRRLKVQEVLTLVEFYERIIARRKRRRRELARLRKEKSRRKLRDAAKEGNVEALLKVGAIKKAAVANSAKYRKAKKELRDKMNKNVVEGKRGEV